MFASSLNAILKPHAVHYGWVMACLAFFTTVFSSTAITTPSIILLSIAEHHGWAISDVSKSLALMFLILAVMAPFGSALMLRIGVIKVVIISGTLMISGLVITIFASEKWHLLIGIGVFLGTASGILGLGLAATVALRWFEEKKGLVVGILTSGFAAGQLIFVPLIGWLTTIVDWRFAILPAAIGSLTCAILFFFLGKNWPADLGLRPYGALKIFTPPKNTSINPFVNSCYKLKGAISHPGFWLLAITFFICGLTSNGLVTQHFIPFCADNNVGIIAASSYLAIMGIFNFIGTTASGWLSDRFDNFNLLATYYGFRGLSLLYLPYSNFDAFSLSVWALFFGLDFIATVPPTIRLSGKFFGPVDGPIIFGWVFAFHQLGAAVAAFGAGESRDILFTYNPAFISAGIVSILATILIIFFKYSPFDTLRERQVPG
ncbi:MFS transporter [Candidatus Puniceispirillum sp.]|nr:MFS transporter [Candidatus Puniceispirillum sp.]